MNPSLESRVRETLRRRGMVRAGDRVAVAVSGGADSVALLLLLDAGKIECGITLVVAHFNHRLRGAESDADERFVAALAEDRGLPFLCGREDVAGQARRQGGNLEEVARGRRYAFFRHVVESDAAVRVAVAHTADDQAETVLAHLLRGTGPTGLAGIHPVVGPIIRPLLEVRRSELRDFLRARGQAWREDPTNLDTTRLRARIRHHLLPLLEREFQGRVVPRLATLAHLARADEQAWDALLDPLLASRVHRTDTGLRIRISDLLFPLGSAPGAGRAFEGVSRRIIRRIIQELAGHRRRLTAEHVGQVLRLASDSAAGAALHLPHGVRVRRTLAGELDFLLAGAAPPPAPYAFEVDLLSRQTHRVGVAQLGKRFVLKVIDWPGGGSDTKMEPEALDCERLGAPVVFRSWQPGDAYCPRGHRKACKLKRLFWERGVDSWKRPFWPVLSAAGGVVWAWGFPPAAGVAAGPATRVGLVIEEEEE